ncbi:MAG: hypothetical protein HYY03_00880 [Chloroflexi bacterium]|nr:hypothetical protein [Chloroflexota bacterium]
MLLKGCRRCGGDLYDEPAPGQVDMVCLQCGYRASGATVESLALKREPDGAAGEPALPAGGCGG